jgi:hypothetical protein
MADMSISERPVTQQGLSGMRPVTSGPGRMVQDASYFVGLLRQKINEITVEIGRMRSDADKAAKDSAVLVQYERKYDVLIKEVRGLEGDLADYNLAMDKSRTSMVRYRAALVYRPVFGASGVVKTRRRRSGPAWMVFLRPGAVDSEAVLWLPIRALLGYQSRTPACRGCWSGLGRDECADGGDAADRVTKSYLQFRPWRSSCSGTRLLLRRKRPPR